VPSAVEEGGTQDAKSAAPSVPSAVPSAVEEGGTQDAKSAAPRDADEGEWAEDDDEEDEWPTTTSGRRRRRTPDTALGEHSHSEPYVPDIVIINRYGRHGSLGLHQDKDESAASLAAGTPIVSISLGDSCVFVVGPPTAQVGGAPPPPSECQYVRLHSGDAIVFGGPSRLVWHGVKSVFSGSAPGFLRLPEKPCRLNLTMRRF
jgi:alkylated DNA repair dioxygenase AlkB